MLKGLVTSGKIRTLIAMAVTVSILSGIGFGGPSNRRRNKSVEATPVEQRTRSKDGPSSSTEHSAHSILFSVQIAERLSRSAAEQLSAKLKALGYDAYTEAPGTDSDSEHKVKVGRYKDLSQPDEVIRKLQKDGFSPVVSRFKASSGVQESSAVNTDVEGIKAQKNAGKEPAVIAQPVPTMQAASNPTGASTASNNAPPTSGSQKIIGGLSATGAPPDAPATSEVPADGVDQLSAGGVFTAMRTGGALVFVLSAVVGLFFLLRKIAPERFGRPGRDKLIKAVDSIALGDRRSVMIVDVDGEKYLLGATTQNITLLAKIEGKLNVKAAPAAASARKNDFNQIYNAKKSELTGDPRAQQKNVRLSEVTSRLKELSKGANI